MAVALVTIEKRYGTTMAIFPVSLADREPVFMCVVETPYENEHRGVVIVDAGKFLKLWRADPYKHHQEIATGNPQTWRQDRKFTKKRREAPSFTAGMDRRWARWAQCPRAQ